MQSNFHKATSTILVCATILIAATVYRVTAVKRSAGQQQHKPMEHITDKLPPIDHKVVGLRIVKATLEKPRTPEAMAVLKIRNNSSVAVTAWTITNGDFSVGQDGGLSSDEPTIVVEPHETITFSLPASNLERDVPVRLAAVFYADGTEEGEDIVLEMMHTMRASEKAKRDKQKGGSQQ